MLCLKEVAENYISRKGYDWKYKVVFDDEIILGADQFEVFQQCYKIHSKAAWEQWFAEHYMRSNDISLSPLRKASNERKLLFVLFGKPGLRHTSKWKSNQRKFQDDDTDQLSLDFNAIPLRYATGSQAGHS